MVKYYYMGKRFNTPFQVFKERVKRVFRLCVLVVVLVGIVVGIAIVGRYVSPQIVYKQEVREVILDNLTSKVNELKGNLVNDLKYCESGGFSESDGLVTFDPHPTKKQVQIPSFGLYQFKKSTVQHYYRILYAQEVNDLEAIQIALSGAKSSELASDIIFKTENGLSNWYNCSKKLGLQGRLNLIKELEK